MPGTGGAGLRLPRAALHADGGPGGAPGDAPGALPRAETQRARPRRLPPAHPPDRASGRGAPRARRALRREHRVRVGLLSRRAPGRDVEARRTRCHRAGGRRSAPNCARRIGAPPSITTASTAWAMATWRCSRATSSSRSPGAGHSRIRGRRTSARVACSWRTSPRSTTGTARRGTCDRRSRCIPCTVVRERLWEQCYDWQITYALYVNDSDFAKVFELCAAGGAQPRANRVTGALAVTRSSRASSRRWPPAGRAAMRHMCALGPSRAARTHCVEGIVRNMFRDYVDGDLQARALCRSLTRRTRSCAAACVRTPRRGPAARYRSRKRASREAARRLFRVSRSS